MLDAMFAKDIKQNLKKKKRLVWFILNVKIVKQAGLCSK
jgi:hypothetical protein